MAAGEKLLRSLVAMAAADGRIGKRELKLIEQYREKWGVEPDALERCIAEVEAGNRKVTLPQDETSRRVFLKALVKVAAVDGVIDPGEEAMLRSVAGAMQVPDQELDALVQRALAKVGSDARARVESDPRVEASPEPAAPEPASPPAGPGEPPPPDLLAYVAAKQARGEPVPPELLQLAVLLHHVQPAPQPVSRPLVSRTPPWLADWSARKRITVVGVFLALWLLVPTVTGAVAGMNAVSAAEDRAERIANPTPRQVEDARRRHQAQAEQHRERKKKLEAKLEATRAEATKAREAPERLRRLREVRRKRWGEFGRLFPRGPKEGGR